MAAVLSLSAAAGDSFGNFSTEAHALAQIREGRNTFRYATFGDEAFWGDGIGLHLAVAGAANGGVGPGVSPVTALGVGLKVDVEALPRSLQRAIARGKVDLNSLATTLELLKLDAVVGVTGLFDEGGKLRSMDGRIAISTSAPSSRSRRNSSRWRRCWASMWRRCGSC